MFAAGAAGLLAGCSDATRFSDPLADPFQDQAPHVDRAPTGTIPPRTYAEAAPRSVIQSRPLPPPQAAAPSAPYAQAPYAPAPHPAAPAPRVAGAVNHWSAEGGTPIVVSDGESAGVIANRYGVPVDALLRVNGFARPTDVHPGSRLVIPVYRAGAAAPVAAEPVRTADHRDHAARPLPAELARSHAPAVEARVERRAPEPEPKAEKVKPPVVEAKVEKPKPQAVERPKASVVEARVEKPKAPVAEPKAEKAKPQAAEAKSDKAKPQVAEAKVEKPKPQLAKAEAEKPAPAKPAPAKPAKAAKEPAPVKAAAAPQAEAPRKTAHAEPARADAQKVAHAAPEPARAEPQRKERPGILPVKEMAKVEPRKAEPKAESKFEPKPRELAKKETPTPEPKRQLAAAEKVEKREQKVAAAAPAQRIDRTPVASLPPPQAQAQAQEEKPAPAAEPAAAAAGDSARPEFRWPARGRIIQGFNSGGNDGINISVPEGTQVKAAEGGVVAYAGNELKGYGNLVLIRHPNGFVSAYAHNGELDVKRGDQVKRGQTIAKSGQSGNVGTPQLHFELRKGSTPVDPTGYLAGL
jgi:murein DD-endopeptidase MepM/ murein hydrolase activator NlpD